MAGTPAAAAGAGTGPTHAITRFLAVSSARSAAFTAVCCCLAYTGVYMLRFPPFMLRLDERSYLNVPEKLWVSEVSVLGMALAKIPGVLVFSGLAHKYRLPFLLVQFAGAALLVSVAFSALSGPPLFLSVFLGFFFLSWGYATFFQYLEGRRAAELMTAALNCVVVFGSSVARAAAAWDLDNHPDDPLRMPLRLAGMTAPVYLTVVLLLSLTPPPTLEEKRLRSDRQPIGWAAQKAFLHCYWPGLVPVGLSIGLIASHRAFRDFFALEIYTHVLGRDPEGTDYILADWPGGLWSCCLMVVFHTVEDSRRALILSFRVMAAGAILIGVATFALQTGVISGSLWTVVLGFALFTANTPLSGTLYDRLVASTKLQGTAVFLVYLGDACAHSGSTFLVGTKFIAEATKGGGVDGDGEEGAADSRLVAFFFTFCYVLSISVALLMLVAERYFSRQLRG